MLNNHMKDDRITVTGDDLLVSPGQFTLLNKELKDNRWRTAWCCCRETPGIISTMLRHFVRSTTFHVLNMRQIVCIQLHEGQLHEETVLFEKSLPTF